MSRRSAKAKIEKKKKEIQLHHFYCGLVFFIVIMEGV